MNINILAGAYVKKTFALYRLSTGFSTFSTLKVDSECLNLQFNSLLKKQVKK